MLDLAGLIALQPNQRSIGEPLGYLVFSPDTFVTNGAGARKSAVPHPPPDRRVRHAAETAHLCLAKHARQTCWMSWRFVTTTVARFHGTHWCPPLRRRSAALHDWALWIDRCDLNNRGSGPASMTHDGASIGQRR